MTVVKNELETRDERVHKYTQLAIVQMFTKLNDSINGHGSSDKIQ